MASSLDLTRLLPPRYRDKTLDSLIKNLFNRHLSKEDSIPLFGYVGDSSNLEPGEVQIRERDLERQINQISQLFIAEHANERKIFSWPDIIQKLVLLGVKYENIAGWFKTLSYNFIPPIDLDKFCNYNEYYWIGNWIVAAPSLPYDELGIPDVSVITPVFARSNVDYLPEYYVIEKGDLDVSNFPVSIIPTISSGWSDWSLCNLWIHKDDAIQFLEDHGGLIGFSDLVQANRPIIEYFKGLRLNVYQNLFGEPANSGTYNLPLKQSQNQPPLFDLYKFDGTHLGVTSSIFYYEEGTEFPVDPVLNRRVATDTNNDFIFGHSLVNSNEELYFYSLYESQFKLKTIWRSGLLVSPRYVKYDSSGTLINQDKFINYKNYYWTGVDTSPQPVYNPTGLSEYNVIERGGSSDWSVYNSWVHVSNLRRSELSNYVQATHPIIEFNLELETELLQSKTELGELPKFKQYLYDDATQTYYVIPNSAILNLNDAYLEGKVFARVRDLPDTSAAIASSAEIFTSTFEYEGEQYIQGLFTGNFLPARDGIVYGYKLGTITNPSVGNGQATSFALDSNSIPEVVIATYQGSNIFSIRGSVTGSQPNLTVGTSYLTSSGLTFTIVNGSTVFEIGDTFKIEIKSYVYERQALYLRVNGSYRTLESPLKILSEVQQSLIIDANPSLKNGIWEIPPQLSNNVKNETRSSLKQGDLYYHFISIIKAQPGLIGSEAGKNNWRFLTPNLGLGGTIKQYDGQASLFVSMMLQEGVTPLTLIDFARENYEKLFSSIKSFIQNRIPELLNDGVFKPPVSGNSLDPIILEEFKSYFNNLSPVVTASDSPADDYISTNFFDTTSALNNLVVTLPYLNLGELVEPKKILDLELNMEVLVHHDGHRTTLPTVSGDILKKIVTKNFLRSPGQETPGIISGFNFPTLPYRGQFWFKTSTNQLFYYGVISDIGELPDTAEIGSFSYNRVTNSVYEFNGVWNFIGSDDISVATPWALVDLGLIEQNLILEIETFLYKNCPIPVLRINKASLETESIFPGYLKKELERFGVKYGTGDVYSSSYSSTNAFTWNYSSVTAIGASSAHATWQEIYRDVYGTPRPDLQPWIPAGYASETDLLTDLIVATLIPGLTTEWDVSFWPACAAFISAKYVLNGVTARLSVDTSNGALISPYLSGNSNSLVLTVPTTATNSFVFGDLGPVELFWTKTLDYLYAKQKIYFKQDPLTYIRETWGIKQKSIGEYSLNQYFSRKDTPSIFQLHGDELSDVSQLSWIDVSVVSVPLFDQKYTITYVSRLNDKFKITGTGIVDPIFITNFYTNAYGNFTFTPSSLGFSWGDTYEVTIKSDGTVETSFTASDKFIAEGFNQLYVQYGRSYGQDVEISLNKTLLKEWDIKLGYRFSGMVNTDSLSFKSNDNVIDESAYSIYLKENKFLNSSWINALRVQLVQRGSTQRIGASLVPKTLGNGTPGEDWIFRIDNYNEARTQLSWYTYDPVGEHQTFIALDGAKTLFPWTRPLTITGTVTHNTPFLITGIQNFVNFMFGYSDKLAADGWNVNEIDDPIIDQNTGRPLGYQLLIEKFLVQQFSGVDAGSSFLFNPFSNKVWYKTARGVVSNINDLLGIEQETVATVLDQNRRRISTKNIRVFRQDEVTELVFDVPVYTLHLLTSEYEHVVLFDDYSVESLLIYDPFLGQQTSRIFIEGQKQSVFTGRIDFGGHFLLGDEMRRNVESSISNISKLYDSTSTQDNLPETERARALLGFQKKEYFENRGSPDLTEFRFWQGMIPNKGTNFSVDAYVNSAKYKTAKLDEYWAYKLASYGDARPIELPEMKIEPNDCTTERVNYLFLEDDQLKNLLPGKGFGGYDIPDYDLLSAPYDVQDIYSYIDYFGTEFFDPSGCIIIRPDDESRWFRYLDLHSFQYFVAEQIPLEFVITPTELNSVYVINDSKGNPIRADVFELVDTNYIDGGDNYDIPPYDTELFETGMTEVYYENGNLIPGSDPVEYTNPKFVRLNHSTIQIIDSHLLNRSLKIRAYAPAFKQYSPSVIYDYQNNTTVRNDLIWWDPARGVQHPEAHATIDYQVENDPAKYNVSVLNDKNPNLEKLKPWGDNQLGKFWWNTKNLSYQSYSDTKLYSMKERLARWGATADYSSVEVYEWILSSVPPNDYAGDGVPAMKRLVKRDRTWWTRTVAWKYSSNPGITDRAFSTYQPEKIGLTLSYGRGTAVLKSGSLIAAGLKKGSKFAGAIYSATTKQNSELTRVFGQATLTSDPYLAIGSSAGYNDGPSFVSSPYATMSAELNQDALQFRTEVLGQYTLDNEVNTIGVRFLKLTHVTSGDNQLLEIRNTPVKENTQDTYFFDKLGVKINYVVLYGHDDSWPSIGFTTPLSRKAAIATAVGNTSHEFYVRSTADIFAPIDFADEGTTYTSLDSQADVSTLGWVSWTDPIVNPNRETRPPLNKYEPVVGEWVEVGSYLSDLASEIVVRTRDQWIWFDDTNYSSYRSTWSSWTEVLPEVRSFRFLPSDTLTAYEIFQNELTYSEKPSDIENRALVYVNGVLRNKWSVDDTSVISIENINLADSVRVEIIPAKITDAELKFNPEISDEDPFKIVQYKREVPYVLEERRNQSDNKNIKNYFFWVKDKVVPPRGKIMSVKKSSQLLREHDGTYGTPQVLKYFNQIDSRPNRYGLLSIVDLGHYVRKSSSYKLRLAKNPTLRNSDNDLDLKNTHIEWQLLRPLQPIRLPKKLWDLLTDTMIGENQINQSLPFDPLISYDDRNETSVRYGFDKTQVLVDPSTAKATVKYTVLNTKVDKYTNGELSIDYISYNGFDINQLDTYLSSPADIRQFMTDLWRFAKPKQINEIFFAVLQDAASKNLEMTDFFKTSLISFNEVRTIETAQ